MTGGNSGPQGSAVCSHINVHAEHRPRFPLGLDDAANPVSMELLAIIWRLITRTFAAEASMSASMLVIVAMASATFFLTSSLIWKQLSSPLTHARACI